MSLHSAHAVFNFFNVLEFSIKKLNWFGSLDSPLFQIEWDLIRSFTSSSEAIDDIPFLHEGRTKVLRYPTSCQTQFKIQKHARHLCDESVYQTVSDFFIFLQIRLLRRIGVSTLETQLTSYTADAKCIIYEGGSELYASEIFLCSDRDIPCCIHLIRLPFRAVFLSLFSANTKTRGSFFDQHIHPPNEQWNNFSQLGSCAISVDNFLTWPGAGDGSEHSVEMNSQFCRRTCDESRVIIIISYYHDYYHILGWRIQRSFQFRISTTIQVKEALKSWMKNTNCVSHK